MKKRRTNRNVFRGYLMGAAGSGKVRGVLRLLGTGLDWLGVVLFNANAFMDKNSQVWMSALMSHAWKDLYKD
jgi:hypothetical protein